MSFLWNEGILNPMINALLLLYDVLGNNFVLALTVFTVLIRLVTLPLNLRQQRSMLRTQEMQPQIRAIQEKYRDNPQKMQEEFVKIGYNPAETLTGCLPLLIQMPILIGLYRAIFYVLGSTPQALFELTTRVYDTIDLAGLLPVNNQFLWLNLGQADPYYALPILVFATMFVQQKLLSPATKPAPQTKKGKQNQQPDPTASMNQTMQYTMPIMFGFMSMQFSSGLSIYWVLSNIIGIGQGYYIRRVMAPAREESQARLEANKSKMLSEDDQAPMPAKKELSSGTKNSSTSQRKRSSKRSQSKRKRRSAKR